jgi:SHS2 domain-containing protein
MHETFEHTADLGLRIRAADLDTLFAEAGMALFSAVVDDLSTVEPREKIELRLEGPDREYLLFDWLNELLYRYETTHMLFSKFDVKVVQPPSPATAVAGVAALTATAWGEKLDPARHLPGHEVKAITYHELKVIQTPDGWLAEVIVDI